MNLDAPGHEGKISREERLRIQDEAWENVKTLRAALIQRGIISISADTKIDILDDLAAKELDAFHHELGKILVEFDSIPEADKEAAKGAFVNSARKIIDTTVADNSFPPQATTPESTSPANAESERKKQTEAWGKLQDLQSALKDAGVLFGTTEKKLDGLGHMSADQLQDLVNILNQIKYDFEQVPVSDRAAFANTIKTRINKAVSVFGAAEPLAVRVPEGNPSNVELQEQKREVLEDLEKLGSSLDVKVSLISRTLEELQKLDSWSLEDLVDLKKLLVLISEEIESTPKEKEKLLENFFPMHIHNAVVNSGDRQRFSPEQTQEKQLENENPAEHKLELERVQRLLKTLETEWPLHAIKNTSEFEKLSVQQLKDADIKLSRLIRTLTETYPENPPKDPILLSEKIINRLYLNDILAEINEMLDGVKAQTPDTVTESITAVDDKIQDDVHQLEQMLGMDDFSIVQKDEMLSLSPERVVAIEAETEKLIDEWLQVEKSLRTESMRVSFQTEASARIDAILKNEQVDDDKSNEINPAVSTESVQVENDEEQSDSEPVEQSGFKESLGRHAEQFKRRFTGELRTEEKEDYEATGVDTAKALAGAGLGAAMSIFGVKIIPDAIQYGFQRRYTNKERASILDALKAAEKEPKLSGHELLIEKQRVIAERIQQSEFLTETKKAKLIGKIEGIINKYEQDLEDLEEKRNKEIIEVLKKSIETRIKETEVLKQGINTLFKVTGLEVYRLASFSAVSLFERHRKVSKEIEEGERPDAYWNEMIVSGIHEKINEFEGGGAKTIWGRNISRIKALGTLATFGGLATFAFGDDVGDIAPGKHVEGLKKSLTEALEAADDRYPSNPVVRFFTDLFNSKEEAVATPDSSTTTTPATVTPPPKPTPTSTTTPTPSTAETSTPAPVASVDGGAVAATTEPGAETGAAASAESSAPVETPIIEVSQEITVSADRDHNSITALLRNQYMEDPKSFGYTGDDTGVKDWALDKAVQTARDAGAIREDGDTRLDTDAIGKIAVHATKDGGIQLVDTATGEAMTFAEAEEQGLTYESGSRIGSITERSIASDPTPHSAGIDKLMLGKGVEVDFEHGPDSTVTGAEITGMDLNAAELKQVDAMMASSSLDSDLKAEIAHDIEVVKQAVLRIEAYERTLHALEDNDLGDSAEAHLVRREMLDEIARIGEQGNEELASLSTETLADIKADVEASESDVKIKVKGLGRIKFDYDGSHTPSINLDDEIAKAPPSFATASQELLDDNWEEDSFNGIDDRKDSIKETAMRIFIYEKALRSAQIIENPTSGEAVLLRRLLAAELRSGNAEYLDRAHNVIKHAAETSGIILVNTAAPEAPVDTGGGGVVAVNNGEPTEQTSDSDAGKTRYQDGEKLGRFANRHGRVRFHYNLKGEVTNVNMARFDHWQYEEQALSARGITSNEIYRGYKMVGGYPDTTNTVTQVVFDSDGYNAQHTANDMRKDLVNTLGETEAFRTMLVDMQNEELRHTPEYGQILRKIESNELFIEKELADINLQREA
ncbi:hypothetical protein HOI18_04335 [Candidatus Uhrbacteria bacterium]|nr:hypothetical protein [Candidatus Uhrbacteria bacterium]